MWRREFWDKLKLLSTKSAGHMKGPLRKGITHPYSSNMAHDYRYSFSDSPSFLIFWLVLTALHSVWRVVLKWARWQEQANHNLREETPSTDERITRVFVEHFFKGSTILQIRKMRTREDKCLVWIHKHGVGGRTGTTTQVPWFLSSTICPAPDSPNQLCHIHGFSALALLTALTDTTFFLLFFLFSSGLLLPPLNAPPTPYWFLNSFPLKNIEDILQT